jgi:nanoRNase/pAp phosphatase (c-di-AMP/oligoRNAs hydrolase)
MNNGFQAKKLMDSSQNISVFTPASPGVDVLSSAFSLCYALGKKEKNVACLPQIRNLPEKYYNFFPQELIPKDFVISIQGKEISELYYERKNHALKIYLTLKDGKIEKEDIHFNSLHKPAEENPDLLVTIGMERLERLGNYYEKNFKLFWQTPIINIDNQSSNNQFGNINLINQKIPLSAILKSLLVDLDKQTIDHNIRTWLLAGIIEYSKDLHADSSVLKNIFELISSSIDYKKIIGLFYYNQKIAYEDLLCATLSRLRFEKQKHVPYAFLTKDVFSQTRTAPKNLVFVLKYLTGQLFPFNSLLLLWESNASFAYARGIFYSKDNSSTKSFLRIFGGEKRGEAIVFSAQGNNIESIGEKILNKIHTIYI